MVNYANSNQKSPKKCSKGGDKQKFLNGNIRVSISKPTFQIGVVLITSDVQLGKRSVWEVNRLAALNYTRTDGEVLSKNVVTKTPFYSLSIS